MKSLIIDGFDNFEINKILEKTPFDKIFYIGEIEACNKVISLPNVRVYNCHKIPLGQFPEDYNFTEPLDEEIINKFSNCESIVMKMFERNDFWFQSSFDQRKQWYLINLRYWYDIVHNNNVVCFVKCNFAHEVYDYIIYSIVKDKNEKSFFFSQLSFMNRFILEDDIYNYSRLSKCIENNTKSEIDNSLKQYLEKQRIPADKTHDVFQIIENQRGFAKNQHKIIKIYNKKYAIVPELEKQYVFVALHMQPEMTTCPLAGQFVYQDLIIELLDYYLPKDIYIYIKEHPAQTVVGRSIDFYEKFYKRNRIKFVKTNINSRVLLDNSLAVVTCTGTIGWEALIRTKPVLSFGNYFYKFAPGCYSIKSKQDLIKAIDEIIIKHKVPLKNEIDCFFQTVYNYSYFGYIDSSYKEIIDISTEDNSKIIQSIIEKEIFSLFRV